MCYVYVITDCPLDESEVDDLGVSMVKIGHTAGNIKHRIRQLQTGNPRPLRVLEIFEYENTEMAKQMEKMIHWKLSGHGLIGEWFAYQVKTKAFLGLIAFTSKHIRGENLESYLENLGE